MRRSLLSALTLTASCLIGCGNDMGTSPTTSCGTADGVLSGAITQDCTLTADKKWRLQGQVTVAPGATLTIKPGTTVLGSVGMPTSFLLVDRGAKIDAVGTKDQPIVFTSERPVGQRVAGDWGGVVLKGRSIVNLPGGEGMLEGEAGPYGGGATPNPDDSSGTLKYVRIEFAGRIIATDNELNGLTLGAVGRGTKIEYVQVHQGLDDGIEMFGGTVDLKHCVVSAAQDDGYDWDLGYSGRGQFLIVKDYTDDGNYGIEADTNPNNDSAMPRSNPTYCNVSLVGTGRGSVTKTAAFQAGIAMRSGTEGKIYNAIITGYKDAGLTMIGNATPQRAIDGGLVIANSIFALNGAADAANVWDAARLVKDKNGNDTRSVDPRTPTTVYDLKAWITTADKMNREVMTQPLVDPLNMTAPNFAPTAGSAALSGAKACPSDGFFETTTYVGAVDPSNDWTKGWTAYPQN